MKGTFGFKGSTALFFYVYGVVTSLSTPSLPICNIPRPVYDLKTELPSAALLNAIIYSLTKLFYST
jgi:hypothetical protein